MTDNEPPPIARTPQLAPSKAAINSLLAVWWAAVALLGLWCVLALYYAYLPAAARVGGAAALLLLSAAVLIRRSWRRITLPMWLAACTAVIGWHLLRAPSNERDWAPQQARTPDAKIEAGRLTIENVRHFEWRTREDFTERWERREYDLDEVSSLDLVLTYFASQRVAHTCLSFGFADGRYLHVSIESRRRRDEGFNPIAGLFRRYELIYIVSDERDSLAGRVVGFGEQVYVFPTRSHPEIVRALLVSMLHRGNYLAKHPAFYHTLFQNCTTAMLDHINGLNPGVVPYDSRVLLNGAFDRMCYELGWLKTDQSFESTRAAAYINDRVRDLPLTADFSTRLRGL